MIHVNKFGTTLTSRQLGREAFAGFEPNLADVTPDETVTIDFTGVDTFSPSWGDEFLSKLYEKFGERLKLKATENPSVRATIKVLEDTNSMKFQLAA